MQNQNDPTAEVFDVVYGAHADPIKTQKEIDFVKAQVGTKNILDLGCGSGRHMIPMLRQGFEVTGLDASSGMLNLLREKLNENKLTAKIIHQDISKVSELNGEYEGIICLWNAFNEIALNNVVANKVLKVLYDALRTGGKIIIEVYNPASIKVEGFDEIGKTQNSGKVYNFSYKTIDFDHQTNITISKETIVIQENGKTQRTLEAIITQKWWSKEELGELCLEAGFSEINFFGDQFTPFQTSFEKIIVVAKK